MEKGKLDLKDRNMGIDLLRILSMVGITIIHFIGYSGLLRLETISTSNYCIFSVLKAATSVSTNIFVMITGYCLIGKNTK